jgi:hypothetical protein
MLLIDCTWSAGEKRGLRFIALEKFHELHIPAVGVYGSGMVSMVSMVSNEHGTYLATALEGMA